MDEMAPKERWLAVLRRRKPDRMPMDYWGTPEATQRVKSYLGVRTDEELYRRLHIDKVFSVEPRYVGPSIPEDADIFGCRYRNVPHSGGAYRECIYHPLAQYRTVSEVERNYRWPDVELFDYTCLEEQIRGKDEYPILGGGSEPFLTYKNLRGERQAYIDLSLNPEMVHYCLGKLFDFCYENTVRIFKQLRGEVMLTYVAEDFGSQNDLLYSPTQIREFMLPGMRRMIGLAHKFGVFVVHHSDGAIRRILPDMVEAGIDILNPVQWRCKGMDRRELKATFGDRIVFYGAMDNQYTLPFGSVEEVRKEVLENIKILGAGGGYVLAPCHNIQVITPPENVIAMYRAGYEYGREE